MVNTHNTGKVRIGLCHIPQRQLHTFTHYELMIQRALLSPIPAKSESTLRLIGRAIWNWL